MWGVTEDDGDIRGWRKARSEIEKKLAKFQEKEDQTQKLIDLGRLVVKAQIGELEKDLLLGAFLEIRDIIKNPRRSEEATLSWSKKGREILEETASEKHPKS